VHEININFLQPLNNQPTDHSAQTLACPSTHNNQSLTIDIIIKKHVLFSNKLSNKKKAVRVSLIEVKILFQL